MCVKETNKYSVVIATPLNPPDYEPDVPVVDVVSDEEMSEAENLSPQFAPK